MRKLAPALREIAVFFGAQDAPALVDQECDRAVQRAIVSLVILGVWVVETVLRGFDRPQASIGLPVISAYLLATLYYWRSLRANGRASLPFLYAFLALDSAFVVFLLVLDPAAFAFLHPLLLVVVIRTGIRYGLRTMYLSWGTALIAAPLLLTSRFWRTETELVFAFLLMLLCIPMFFSSLVRRIHNARAIEEEQARLAAVHEAVLARSSFLARVSHELRSPLQGIVSALDVLAIRHGPESQADDELIGRMRRASLLLNTHLRDLLTLANGEAGHLEIRPESFDACALVESVAASASELASDKGLRLVVELPPSRTFVVADCARIDQILTNLVINSIRYTTTGEVRILMAAYDANLRRLRFKVSDTGPGIPEAMLPMLLSPDKTSTGAERRGSGSGIGLAIVRTLMTYLGGQVEVVSRVGVGTTFSLSIPAEPVASVEVGSSPDSQTGRVLIGEGREVCDRRPHGVGADRSRRRGRHRRGGEAMTSSSARNRCGRRS